VHLALLPGFFIGGPMDVMGIARYAVLALSAAAMVFGVLIILGVLVPVQGVLPDQYRIIAGAVVVLYGLYRFVIAVQKATRP
jgi:hypothetical protein